MAGLLVIPRFTMGIASDAGGVTRRWATAVGPSDEPLPETAELFDAVIWQYGTSPEAADQGAQVTVSAVTTALDSGATAAKWHEQSRRCGHPEPRCTKSCCPGR